MSELHSLPMRALQRLSQSLQGLARARSGPMFAALSLPFGCRASEADRDAEQRHSADLKHLFDRIDADGNGKIDQNELQVRRPVVLCSRPSDTLLSQHEA